ncbi:recombinase family protein [Lacrimispora sp. NSJ-141]|uniref:Recombinase family protein n=1 Tax=Lientehia hominis TaxID=2897778 RepID=A0AAP2RG52_9FIRM|nr:recombinase family protein [Lientehia hominis]MCD2491597.1 recombinase family protein [Lientehia hominis]
MQKLGRKDKFTHLLVWKINRISRNLIDFIEMYQELQKRHVIFVSRTEQFDTSSAIENAMLRIILTFAQLESEMTSERIHAELNFESKHRQLEQRAPAIWIPL